MFLKINRKKKPGIQLGDKVVAIKTTKSAVKDMRLWPYKKLADKADRVFAKKVKSKSELPGGYCRCYTCGSTLLNNGKNKKLHCGHFITRECHLLRWHFDNARPQCFQCNSMKEGKKNLFESRLRDEIGNERVDYLKSNGNNLNKISILDLIEIINKLGAEE